MKTFEDAATQHSTGHGKCMNFDDFARYMKHHAVPSTTATSNAGHSPASSNFAINDDSLRLFFRLADRQGKGFVTSNDFAEFEKIIHHPQADYIYGYLLAAVHSHKKETPACISSLSVDQVAKLFGTQHGSLMDNITAPEVSFDEFLGLLNMIPKTHVEISSSLKVVQSMYHFGLGAIAGAIGATVV